MKYQKKILAILGSTRKNSVNLSLVNAIMELYPDSLNFDVFDRISDIPHFNPDLDSDNPPKAVSDFRKKLHESDGVLICTPEYAMGVPGSLKNALDWTVSTVEFSHKPVALITASTSGQKGHLALMETLKVIESDIPENSQLVIPFIKTKVKYDKIIDSDTLKQVQILMDSLIRTINKKS